MASRSGGGAGWFIVGFLAGVGATLAIIIFATRPQSAHVAVPAMAAPTAPVVTYHAPTAPYGGASSAAGAPSAAPASAAPAYASGPAAAPAATDQQTQDDAAAAGMTSRTRPGVDRSRTVSKS